MCVLLCGVGSACMSMTLLTDAEGRMSLISYRKHSTPHGWEAMFNVCTIDSFSDSRSSNVLSRVILPSSDRMVVCASCVTANAGSWEP